VSRTRIWDIPTRGVHWLLAVLIPFSWWSAHSDHLPWHRLSGYTILGLLVFRVIWGFAGSGTARFAGFVRGPRRVWAYVRGRASSMVGHNPLGGWSILAMLAVLAAQVSLGLFSVDQDGFETGPLAKFVSFDTGRTVAHIHELNFYLLLALILLHLGAITFYAVRGRNLVMPMITGEGSLPQGAAAPTRAPWRSALAAAAVAGAVAWFVAHGLRL
jgi:cytochrome b